MTGAGIHDGALAVLRSGQRALLRAANEDELLSVVCRIAVDEAGYRLAWIGFAEDGPDRLVRPAAQAGYEAGYLESVRISWDDAPLGRGPTGMAIRTGRPAIGRSFLTDPDLAPWRDEALRRGYASAVALPLRPEGGPPGALVIYAIEPDAFSSDDVDLLAWLADDLAFRITVLRSRAAQAFAEDRLRRSERNLAEAQRIAHIGSWEWDLATGVARRSDETHRIYGLAPGRFEETYAAFLALVHPDDLAQVRGVERQAIESGRPFSSDFRIIRPDGAIRVVREVGELVRDASGTPIRMVGTVQDITERLEAEAERARLISAVEQTADSVMIQDLALTIIYVNPAFCRLTGYAPEDVVGQYAGLLDSGHHTPEFWADIWATVAQGATWTGTIVNRRRDGSLVELETVISGLRDASGTVTSYVQTDRDVSRERELEAQLLQSQKMDAIGQLAGGIAHDFNNLLTAIRGYGELARDSAAPEAERRADIDELLVNVDRAVELTQSLLAFGRRATLRPAVLDPTAVVSGIAPLLRRLIGERIQLVTSTTPGLARIRADRGQLEQVIVNLALNARDAMPSGGVLSIAVSADGADAVEDGAPPGANPHRAVAITISDTGVGMDAETQTRIFEPFFTTKPAGQGTGLGLATVHGIVHQSGGTVSVVSEPGQGATFRIVFPAVAAEPDATPPPATAPAARGGRETIVLAEDETAVREFIRRVLAQHGYRVLEAPDGPAALDLLGTHPDPISLLVTDVVMPGLTGPELARTAIGIQPGIRVLYVSGYPRPAGDPSAFQPGAYLTKPFTTEALVRAVREALDQRGP